MSTTSTPALAPPDSFGKRMRHLVVGALFVLVLLIPKMLQLRRNPRSWMFFRIFLAIAGPALVIFPLGAGSSYIPAIVGLAMFVSAILLPPAKSFTSTSDKVRELRALVVVNGGRFKLGDAASFSAQLFVSANQIRVLDSHLQSLLEIPVGEITSARAEESHGRWFLRVHWSNKTAAFLYRGVFAEHLACVAESTIHSVMRSALPVLPQSRAASA